MPTAIDRFEMALRDHAEEFGVQLDAAAIAGLRSYYEVLLTWNARLHLVAPCSPEEFATRHVLESVLLLPHLKPNASVVDVGSGGGLPLIPVLIARRDVTAMFVESSQRKAVFLREALRTISRHATVIANRFENITPPSADNVTCRALDRMPEKLAALLEWVPANGTLLLFGGPAVKEKLQKLGREFTTVHVPRSQRRYLLIIPPR